MHQIKKGTRFFVLTQSHQKRHSLETLAGETILFLHSNWFSFLSPLSPLRPSQPAWESNHRDGMETLIRGILAQTNLQPNVKTATITKLLTGTAQLSAPDASVLLDLGLELKSSVRDNKSPSS
jgi:hypothetical protein